MPQYLRRIIVSAWIILAAGTVIFFTYRSGAAPMLKLVVVGGGFIGLFIFIKSYLFRM